MTDSDDISAERPAPAVPTSYTCPGESYSIPRSIHLARLAAFYSKCRDCEHRFDAGHAWPHHDQTSQEVARPVTRSSLLTDENVRGVYLNELDRNRAKSWGEALAAVLWDQQPMRAQREPADQSQIVLDEPASSSPITLRCPTVVVAFDERPSSPDIISGAVLGLRHMGCSVIDIGQTAMPVLAYNVQTLSAAAGLYVTGAGADASYTGFDFLGRNAIPFSRDVLQQIERYVGSGVGRQTRQIGGHHPQQGLSSYESSLAIHFHALRPFRIVCGTSTRISPRILDRLFAKLPCKLTHVSLPRRNRDLFDPRDIDLQRVAQTVVEGQQHLGLVIDEDCQHLAFVTDRGRLVTPREIARLLIELAQRENPTARLILATSLMNDATDWLSGRHAKIIDGGESIAELVHRIVEQEAILGLSADGRVWFQLGYPACDALLVLANVLQALSLSDTPFSEVITRINDS